MSYTDYFSLVFSNSELAKFTGDPTGATIKSELLLNIHQRAVGLIDSYITIRNPLFRFANVFEDDGMPGLLKHIYLELLVVLLYENYYRNSMLPQTIESRKKAVKEYLYFFSKGYINIATDNQNYSTDDMLVKNTILTNKDIVLNNERLTDGF